MALLCLLMIPRQSLSCHFLIIDEKWMNDSKKHQWKHPVASIKGEKICRISVVENRSSIYEWKALFITATYQVIKIRAWVAESSWASTNDAVRASKASTRKSQHTCYLWSITVKWADRVFLRRLTVQSISTWRSILIENVDKSCPQSIIFLFENNKDSLLKTPTS